MDEQKDSSCVANCAALKDNFIYIFHSHLRGL